ncbi:MAG TPA: YcfL family protein [Verrucomicrobiota bacterium]|nr:YcfL family protein [Verrucomicrobiota bacterium]
MKQLRFAFALLLMGLSAGCAGHQGAYPPVNTTVGNQEMASKFVLMDPGAQYSVTSSGLQETRLDDGRLQVVCVLRNQENRRIQVQVQCVFKDPQGFATGDETPWENVILTENSMETVRFVSLNNQAATYTIRVRQAR